MTDEPTKRRVSRRKVAWIATGFGAVLLGGVLWTAKDGGPPPIPPPQDQRAMAVGAQLYARHCASCHGTELQGQPNWRDRAPNGRLPAPPHDESGHTWHHSDEVLFQVTKKGLAAVAPPGYESDMPAFEGVLSDQEIAVVLGFIKSTWPPSIRERQARLSAKTR